MKTLKFFLLLLCLWSFATLSIAQANWKIISISNEPITSHTFYALQTVTNKSYLIYKKSEYGINLGWNKKPKPEFQFVKESGGEIKCGDKVALFNSQGGYIKHESREYGIELKWSQTPVFEWEIRTADNIKGTTILPNTTIGLYNRLYNDFMRKCTMAGMKTVDLVWVLDCPEEYKVPDNLKNTTYNEQTRDEVVHYLSKILVEKKRNHKKGIYEMFGFLNKFK